MTKTKPHFGSDTRAVDGCIVTFERDGERWCKQFTTVIHNARTKGKGAARSVTRRTPILLLPR